MGLYRCNQIKNKSIKVASFSSIVGIFIGRGIIGGGRPAKRTHTLTEGEVGGTGWVNAKNDDKTGVREREAKKISSLSLREGPAGVLGAD